MEYQRQNTYDRILEKEAPMKILDYAFSEVAYYRKNLSQFQSKEHDDGICRTLPDLPMLDIESVYKSYGDFIADPYQKFPKSQNVIIKRAYANTILMCSSVLMERRKSTTV